VNTTPQLSRFLIGGAVLAIVGILSFVLLWVVFGAMGVANAPRLFVSMCIPPVIIGVIVGVYALIQSGKNQG
jgi:lipopolysaccharide export LptBFGC system permease protein LptF